MRNRNTAVHKPAIHKGHFAARSSFEQLRPHLCRRGLAEAARALERHLDEMDYKLAAEALDDIGRSLGHAAV